MRPVIFRSSLSLSAVLLGAAALWLAPANRALAADAQHPTVIELFQSQGCNSCPPANANLNALSGRADVLALSFAVTYWDSLGWKDTFARQKFTDRQWSYARAMGSGNVYTPQVIVNGKAAGVGAGAGEIEALAARAERGPGPSLSISGASVLIGAAKAPAGGAEVWLVRYDPRQLDVAVKRGENAGKTLPHRNIVKELTLLGHWSGQTAQLNLPGSSDPALATAVLLQTAGAGAILAAVKG